MGNKGVSGGARRNSVIVRIQGGVMGSTGSNRPNDRRIKHKRIRVTLYLSARIYKVFLALCKLLSTSASAEVDKLILAKILFWSENLSDREIRSFAKAFSLDLLASDASKPKSAAALLDLEIDINTDLATDINTDLATDLPNVDSPSLDLDLDLDLDL